MTETETETERDAARAAGIEAMAFLRAFLDDCGYAQLYAALAGGGLFPADRGRAATDARAMGGEASAVLQLLACDEPVATATAREGLRAVVAALQRAGLACADGDMARLDDLVVVPVLGGYLLTATPPGWRTAALRSGRAYLGEDSLRLARVLPATDGAAVLDLGSGCGIQGLLAARGAATVVLSDIEHRSLELGELNAHLNGVAPRTEVVAGDCYEPVAGRRFDLIVTLAPYLPCLLETTDDVVAAGPDGLALLRRILAGAADHLRPGGELVTIAQLLCDDDGPLLESELEGLAPSLDARLTCFDPHPLQPYALELATKLAPVAGGDVAALYARFMTSLRSLGATGICTSFVRLRAPRPDGVARPRARAMHLVQRWGATTVLAPVPGLRVGVDKRLFAAAVGDGPATPLAAPVAALLGAFDGQRELSAAVEMAWGAPPGADRRDLLDQAIERVGELERAGLLVPVSRERPLRPQARLST